MLIDLSSSQLTRGSSLSTDELVSGLTDNGYEFVLIDSEYKGLSKTGTFVYNVTFRDTHSDNDIDTANIYVNFINERLYEVEV